MKNIINFIFGMILIIAFMWVTNLENELVHEHVTETYGYAGGAYGDTYAVQEWVELECPECGAYPIEGCTE